MKTRFRLRIMCLMTALLLLLPGMARAQSAEEQAESGEIQVLLKSLGDVSSLSLTLDGSYSLNGNTGFRFDEDAAVRVTAAGNEVWLYCGGLSLNMGESVTLTRHEKEGDNGLYIAGSQRGKLYSGSLRVSAADGLLRPVLLIDIEEYLLGVLPYEMNDAFPMEALKAQAVAARTYALQRRADRGGRDYDVVDTTADQVFMGYDPAHVNAIAAVEATRGVAGMYKGRYATCYYTATNGGQTAMAHDVLGVASDDGYLDVRDDPYDLENPKSQVTSLALRSDAYDLPDLIVREMKAACAEALSAMDYSEEAENIFIDEIVSVVPHTPLAGEPSRMYQYLTVTFRISACPMLPKYSEPTNLDRIHALFGRNTYEPVLLGYEPGDPVLLEEEFRCDIGIYDQLKDELGLKISHIDCEITTVTEQEGAQCKEFLIELRRFGHGVGMSQRGAQQMAGYHGKTYDEILAFYYPGLSFEAHAFTNDTLPPADSLPAGVALTAERTSSEQKELPALEAGEKYAKVTLATAWSTLNVRASASTEAEILTTLANGWRVIVMEEADGWAHVRTADAEGYVSAQYLTPEE